METMEEFFAGRFALRRSADGSAVTGEVTFTPDLQGPPDRAHGGGVMAACFRVAAEMQRGAGGGVAGALPLRVVMALKDECPIGAAVRVEAEAAADAACALRLLGPKGVVVQATGGPPSTPPPDPQPTMARWEVTRSTGLMVPGTRGCLACGSENPRGLSVRLEYNDEFVWKVLSPRPHFRNPDGTAFWGIAPIILDEIGWWLGALRAREFGVTNVVEVTMHRPIPAGDLIVLGDRADLRQLNKRTWRASALLLDPAWNLLATAQVEFAASRVYAKLLVPTFTTPADQQALARVFPKYAKQE
jgi:hypothetical protein